MARNCWLWGNDAAIVVAGTGVGRQQVPVSLWWGWVAQHVGSAARGQFSLAVVVLLWMVVVFGVVL